jgi:septum formation protein
MPMDIDETPNRLEHPRSLSRRLATEKAQAAYQAIRKDAAWQDSYVLGSDTVVAVGRRIIGKAEYSDEALAALHLLSGRSHWVYTGICLISPNGKVKQKVAETKVRFKRLTSEEINAYVASGQWRGKAGAYGIQGIAGAFVQKLTGSYTNVVGLPLFETANLLSGEGLSLTDGWMEG